MEIVTGLFDHMVVQRNSRDVSDARFSGTCAGAGKVVASVKLGGKVLSVFSAKAVGKAAGGKFEGRLAGLPVGGPYEIILTIAGPRGRATENLTVRDLLVGDVWLLGGQSNMEGCGYRTDRAKPHPKVRAFYMTDRWGVAEDPIHQLCLAVDWVHNHGMKTPDTGDRGVGPGVAFGQEMHRLTGVPQGLIACAHGGTSMSQWDPALKREGGRSLYGATVRRFIKNGSRVAGMAWYQGCSDADVVNAPLYTKRMKKLVAASRRDFGNAKLPWVVVQIARVAFAGPARGPWSSIQEQQRLLPAEISNLAVTPAIDLEMDDAIHISGTDQQRLGRRMAQAMYAIAGGCDAQPPQIEFAGATVLKDGRVEVRYRNVVGGLRAAGRPIGFALVDAKGASNVYRTTLEGDRAIVWTGSSEPESQMASLYYGYGMNCDCNITDAADRSLPVMGPAPLGRLRAVTPFVPEMLVSRVLPSAGKLHGLAYPRDKKPLKLAKRIYGGSYTFVRDDIVACGQDDGLIYLGCSVDCAEAMGLRVLLGYDGPVKVWMDGRELLHDPDGINPIVFDASKLRFRASKGRHELLVALGTNFGNACGISLRLERLGVTHAQLKQGFGAFAMPVMSA